MEDHRKSPRGSIHWRSLVITEENGKKRKAHGKTHDVSLTGVSVVCDLNLPLYLTVTVYLLVHPGDHAHPQLVVEATGKIMNSVLSSQQGGFRLGIQFTKFAGDSKELLQKHLPKGLGKAPSMKPATVANLVEDQDMTPNTGTKTADVAPADASPADASPADASPADASPADASPADASPAEASPVAEANPDTPPPQ